MIPDQTTRLAVIIPAYKPSAGLIDLVQTLSQKSLPAIVIVDDGSGPEFREIFERVAEFPKVHMLRHAVNLGKGAALKTAFNYSLCAWPNLVGVVTGDADGQHHPDDIEAVAHRLERHPDSLVLGCRSFGKDVPLRSRFGNIATRKIMYALLGQKLTDTQTGLRGIPATLLPKLMRTESTGYEFELEMLIAAHQLEIPMVEEPIRTIYEEGNKSSHFNPIVDSMKIYFVLLRFGSVSAMTALIDNIISILVIHQTGNVLGALVLGRVFAVAFNYWMVRSSVFYSKQQHKSVLPKYLTLVVVSGTAAYQGIQFLHAQFGINPIPAKLMVETLLFFVNFAVQRLFIFKPQEKAPAEGQTTRTLVVGGIIALVFAILVGVEVHGLRTSHLFSQEIWFPVGWKRFTKYTGIFLALAAPLLLMVPWTFAAGIAAALLALTAVSVGPLPVLATSFFLISACALGSKLFGRAKDDSIASHLCSTLAGTGVFVFVMLLTARLPVHYPWTWTALLAIPILWDLQGVRRRMVYWLDLVRNAELRCPWERATFALLVFFVIAQWFVAVKPETSTDGLAMHLAIPLDIAANHRLTFEPSRFLWSVMPMGADWGYSIVALLGRRVCGAASELCYAAGDSGIDLRGGAAVGHPGRQLSAGGIICGDAHRAAGDRVAVRRELCRGAGAGAANSDVALRSNRREAISVPGGGDVGRGDHGEDRVRSVRAAGAAVPRGGSRQTSQDPGAAGMGGCGIRRGFAAGDGGTDLCDRICEDREPDLPVQ